MKLFSPLFAKIFGGLALLLAIGFAVQTVRVEHLKKVVAVLRIDLVAAKARTEAEIAAHKASKKAYADAQAEAARMEEERNARIAAQQKEITDEAKRSFQDRTARVRADYERRLRAQTGTGVGGSSGGEQMPCLRDASGRAYDAACPLSEPERLTAELQAIQLEELQNHVRRQAAVPVN